MTDQSCDPVQFLPIPLRVGDDWGLQFTYKNAAGAAIDLTGKTISGVVYPAFVATTYDLNVGNGRVAIVDSLTGKFAVGLEKAVTEILVPDVDPLLPASALRILLTDVTIRTLALFDLYVTGAHGELIVLGDTLPVFVDPISGDKIALVGYSNAVPTP